MHPNIIRLQTSNDYLALSALHKEAFGPGRFTRTAYRLREHAVTEPRLNLCVELGDALIGAVQFTPLRIGGREGALLLGPLVIAPSYKNQGYGLKLMLESIERAKALGYRLMVLVGDEPYYARAGFAKVPAGLMTMPGPVAQDRFLYKELEPQALQDYRGPVLGAQTPYAREEEKGNGKPMEAALPF